LSNSKAARRKDLGDVVKDIKKKQIKDAGLLRQNFTGLNSVDYGNNTTSSSGSNSSTSQPNLEGLLQTSGDTMMGPLAFYPATVTIASGVATISQGSVGFSSRIILNGEGSVADDLDTITGAAHAGQILFIQAVSTTAITLKHATGNIYLPDATDYVIAGKEIVMLQWDTINTTWTIVANFLSPTGAATPSAIVDSTTNVTVLHAGLAATTTIGGTQTFTVGNTRTDWNSHHDLYGPHSLEFYDESVDDAPGVSFTQNQNDFTINTPDADDQYIFDFNGTVGMHIDKLRTRFHSNTPNTVSAAISLWRNDPSPKDNDVVGDINFDGEDSDGHFTTYVDLWGVIEDATSGTEDGRLVINVMKAGTKTSIVEVTPDAFEPGSDNSIDLGSASLEWKNLYIDGTANIDELSCGAGTFSTSMTVTGTTILGDGGTDNILINGRIITDVNVDSGKKISAYDSTEMAFQVGNESLTTGSEGSMVIGYISNSTNAPSDATVDGWFGDVNGAMGIQHYTTAPNYRIWIRANGAWFKAFAT